MTEMRAVVAGPTGLTASTDCEVFGVNVKKAVEYAIATDLFMTEAPDVTAPVLTLPALTITDETTRVGGFTTDEAGLASFAFDDWCDP